jgi:hypothetical protein
MTGLEVNPSPFSGLSNEARQWLSGNGIAWDGTSARSRRSTQGVTLSRGHDLQHNPVSHRADVPMAGACCSQTYRGL